ncbi:MAG: class I SAM-dependent methyltransferase [Roseiflexus sp.]|nr:class I SAM-dependent methyltransferase [Roseiflexus sp.]
MKLVQFINKAIGIFGAKIISSIPEQREVQRLNLLRQRNHWSTAKYTAGLDLDEARFLSFLNQVCVPYRNDLCRLPRTAAEVCGGYYFNNIWFGPVDGSILYGVIRHFRPNHIIEIGSGFSTHLMRRAITDGSLPTRVTSIDPEPRIDIHLVADTILPLRVEELNVHDIVDRLNEGDILFIDSSHMIVSGGDVPFLFLEVLPRLRPGVLIHVHDIFFPYDYPEEWVCVLRRGWNEQYLVHAFLAFNAAFHILWSGSYMWNKQREALVKALPDDINAQGAGSLWLQRSETQARI